MFVFLTRLGRLVVGIPVVIAVTAILGFNTLTALPVASKHKDPACTISPSSVVVNQTYTITASGLPVVDPVYLIVTLPSGSGTVTQVYPNSDGSWSGSASASASGKWTYTFSGLLTNNKYGAVESCAVSVS
jgi:hypothetical protein